ncbi:ribosomal protein S18 acetylase RimI-like enzyme [Novosphingobium chloroacetimidivorans]|uniref:Ribosomal protein S18 acetylase RimI-like enzyme n=1 Tax=Novosphingobium chloroacetimidivorans TaxID=1428314 RepID=A0A7W7KC72_9SPHN|nr:GNAT family N-acetyltransferase [Novosphingobium chloroacetimidivorans]MBB4859383.1 ribosomal protein S18 acetylase RimI-like enzyme [Novosphingobium chloroacetimidivorans]
MAERPAWTVRTAGPDDASALALVGAATFLDTFAGVIEGSAIVGHCAANHTAESYADLFAKGAQAWLGEAEGGAPVGYALIAEPDLAAALPGDVELKRIYSLSRFHGSGLGGALMSAAVAGAAEHDRLLLGVKADNHRAIAFYRKQGFDPLATRQFNVGGKLFDDLVLARPLS